MVNFSNWFYPLEGHGYVDSTFLFHLKPLFSVNKFNNLFKLGGYYL